MKKHIFEEIYCTNNEYAKLFDYIEKSGKLIEKKLNSSSSKKTNLPYDVVSYHWKLRDKMANYNDFLYDILKEDDLLILNRDVQVFNDLIREEVKKIINNFIKDFNLYPHSIVEFDMKQLRLNKSILDIALKKFNDEMCHKYSKYIYVLLRSDGMLVCVGRSTYNPESKDEGDLFKALYLSGVSGNEKIILSTVFGEEIYDTLRNYYDYAFIIPVTENVEDLEKALGNYFIENKVPILNYFSHMIKNNK
ncbi:hypothetical protein KFV05_02490 [Macrococcoides canis]|uniref:hypothetical protein n=1 Tax=Macrococcoides canis TaxID=1855823 RepID=UPI0020B75251|nr:hypothetical protein [Macrococcus canis]UTH02877.1 hypothetical protein KFV05_02490 [Macrococcus canis]